MGLLNVGLKKEEKDLIYSLIRAIGAVRDLIQSLTTNSEINIRISVEPKRRV